MKLNLNNNLYKRLVFFSVIPAAIISIGITIYFTSLRISDTEALLIERSEALAKQIASENINNVFSGDIKEVITNIQYHLKNNQDLKKAEIYAFEDLLYSNETTKNTNNLKTYEADIKLLPISDIPDNFEEPGTNQISPVTIGKVIIYMNDDIDFKTQELVKVAVITITSIILISVIISIYLTRRIFKPISELVNAFLHLGNKEFNTRVKEDSSHEILVMQKGFNEMAEALENRNDLINREVTQITHDLNTSLQALEIQNIELDIARKEAIESTRTKSRFLANMSHEIRTPMNGIIGFTNLLKKSDLNQKQLYFVNTIEQSSKVLLEILNDILDYSKLEAGKIQINKLPFNLKDTVSQVVNLFTPVAHEKKLRLLAIVYNDVPSNIIGDALRIAQILSNLLSNAIKYTDTGEVVLRVALEEESNKRLIISFTVSDTGTGISEEAQKNLFKPFTQAETEFNRGSSGTGLGLTICQSLSTLMGGSLNFKSQTAIGSTFTVTLPFEQNNSKTAKSSDTSEDSIFKGLNALVYDNHQLSLASINNILINLDFQTKTTKEISDFISAKTHGNFNVNIISISPQQLDNIVDLKEFLTKSTDNKSIVLIPSSDDTIIQELSDEFHCYILKSPAAEKNLKEILKFTLKKEAENHLDSDNKDSDLDFSKLNILVVDDNEINQKLLVELLGSSQAQIITANNGSEAIEFLDNQNIDITFMDIHMPVMDGIKATKIIRQSGYHFPIIALTADVGFTDPDFLNQQGFNGVLIKPINIDNLRNILSQVHKGETIQVKQGDATNNQKQDTHTELPVRDEIQALRITDNQKTVANKLLLKLTNELPAMLEEIDEFTKDKNWKELWQTLHRIHGSASVCAVTALTKAVRDNQQFIDSENYSKLQEGIEKIKFEFKRLKKYSENLIAKD